MLWRSTSVEVHVIGTAQKGVAISYTAKNFAELSVGLACR